MTYQTVTFKDKKYNIDDEKTAKNLTLLQEIEIDKLNKLIEDYKILLNKAEKKLLKLNKKAEKCVSRKKAVKLLKKWDKLEKPIIVYAGPQVPP